MFLMCRYLQLALLRMKRVPDCCSHAIINTHVHNEM